jgi:hypothetical protein
MDIVRGVPRFKPSARFFHLADGAFSHLTFNVGRSSPQLNVRFRLEHWAPHVRRKRPLPRRAAYERDWRAYPATLSVR